jgi:glycosyltransferase involved in cell wall biosynthesis
VTNDDEKRILLKTFNIAASEISVITNGINQEKFNKLSEIKYAPHQNTYTITYIGNIGKSQHFFPLLNAIKGMQDVRLNLIGTGTAFNDIKKHIEKNNIHNVTLPGKLKWQRIIPYYQTSDLLFASLHKEYDTAIPSKLYEYLATGLPVLYNGNGAATDFLKKFNNTFVIEEASQYSLEKLIWRIKKLSPERSLNNLRIIRNNFIREKLSRKYVELTARLLNEKVRTDIYVEDILVSL